MGIRLTDMLSRSTTTDVKFDGELVTVSYYPNAVTLELSDRLDKEARAADLALEAGEDTEFDSITGQLIPVLEWWDVLDDQGERVPPTRANMRKFPLTFLTAVMDAIVADQEVSAGESKGSDGGS